MKIYLINLLNIISCYYSYAIFGLSASSISSYFMPGEEKIDKLFSFFVIYAALSIVKPLGSLIFGYIADKDNRVKSIFISTIISSISMFLVAAIPGYHVWGNVSICFLIFVRAIFLLTINSESDIIRIFLVEYTDLDNKFLINAIVSFCAQIGVVLAALSYYLTSGAITEYWKINFIIGGILGGVISILQYYFYIRLKLYKNNLKYIKCITDFGVFSTIKRYKLQFISFVLLHGSIGGLYNFWIIFFSNFQDKIYNIQYVTQSQLSMILVIIYSLSLLLSGIVTKNINFLIQVKISLALSIILSFIMVFFYMNLQDSCSFYLVIYIHISIVFLMPFYIIPIHSKIQSILGYEVRARLYSLAHSLGSVLLSSSAPIISILLWNKTKLIYIVLFYPMLFLFSIAIFFCVLSRSSYLSIGK
ncbi:MFS transporter [Rickettsia endosymbiont of Cardiosporidium cionae]|uniref:MFS transporter n=1 Tax=Rickettsia endosymbiont of Cardiosporidium cionae TaxID=2777155 RepID=UPI001895CD31|nr:MFS transporter [Rickettsia endosymbiont of Cardiosporidium cionae]KAF8818250.1 MFS transporter [Rickettsia endosymbiont of Cardiosporidium cionae]